MPIHDLFGPTALLLFIILVTIYLFILSSEDNAKKIIRFINTPLALLAIGLSLFSTYYIYEQSKYPNLELEVDFVPFLEAKGKLTSQLGGIYRIFVHNVGDKDAISAWMTGRLQLHGKVGEDIDNFQLTYFRIPKKEISGPYYLRKLVPSALHHGLIGVSCSNCLESKQWWINLDTATHKIELKRYPIGWGMWQKLEPF